MSASSDLAIIRQKVRNVTATPSANELSDTEIDFYINTYLVYDFPEHLRLKTLHVNYTFFTKPNIDKYDFPVEQYISIQKPVYVNGYQQEYHQSQDLFFQLWPKVNEQQTVATGNGVTTNPVLANIISTPVVRSCVSLSATIGGESISFIDNGEGVFVSAGTEIIGITQAANAVITLNTTNNPFSIGDTIFIQDVFGMSQINGGPFTITNIVGADITTNINSTGFDPYQSGGLLIKQAGTVNYLTGAIALDWGNPPDNGTNINAAYLPYVASRPRTILFFGNQFVFRPIPDRAYKVETEVFKVPTLLLNSNQSPELRQWWQLIALGAALKIFEDTQNMDDYKNVLPLYQMQETLANRRTVKQQTQQRVATPFMDQPGRNYGLFYDVYGG